MENRSISFLICVIAFLSAKAQLQAADWNQWRGPDRDGKVAGGPPIATTWPDGGPIRVWTSAESVPGDDNKAGGFASVVVADGRLYCLAAPKRRVELVTRTLDEAGLRQLGWLPQMPPDELVAKVENARLSEARAALKDNKAIGPWMQKWSADNVDADSKKKFATWINARLAAGRLAIDPPTLAKLAAIVNKPFSDQAALDKWLDELSLPADIRKLLAARFPDALTTRDNVVFCLNAADGTTVWKQTFDGGPGDNGASCTPCIIDRRCYVIGMDGQVRCLDARKGDVLWQARIGRPGDVHTSFIVADGVAIVEAGPLSGFDAATGSVLWSHDDVPASSASPVAWTIDGKTLVLVRSGDKVFCVEPKSGTIRWRVAGVGNSNSTPVVDAGRMVVSGPGGISVYKLAADKAELVGKVACQMDYDASPIVVDGFAYTFGRKGTCCVNVEAGKLAWEDKQLVAGSYLSPILVDGKILVQGAANQGYGDGSLAMFSVSGNNGRLLARIPIKQVLCTTPAVVDGLAYCRLINKIACFDLRKP